MSQTAADPPVRQRRRGDGHPEVRHHPQQPLRQLHAHAVAAVEGAVEKHQQELGGGGQEGGRVEDDQEGGWGVWWVRRETASDPGAYEPQLCVVAGVVGSGVGGGWGLGVGGWS